MEETLEKVKRNLLDREELLESYAAKSKKAIRLIEEDDYEEIRPVYFKDIDRIIHSMAYTRYIDKTQVFSFENNDHITHRVLHVQLVSKIARTIGRSLNLNEDLIEAIALGHDLGHTPFGHTGEKFLDNICRKEEIGYFCHNAQGVRVLKDLERVNISVQTLDGILAHNGEILRNEYKPNFEKTTEDFLDDLDKAFSVEYHSPKIKSMTLEGCVVRISDIIAYIGRDIEDAIMLGIIKRSQVPISITSVLGDNNSKIVNTIVSNIIKNSYGKQYIELSKDVFEALMELKRWNYKNIYGSERVTRNHNILEHLFNNLYDIYLEKLCSFDYTLSTKIGEDMSDSEKVFYSFLNDKTYEYLSNTNPKRIIIDYIAGQTDKFFLSECENHIYGFRKSMLY